MQWFRLAVFGRAHCIASLYFQLSWYTGWQGQVILVISAFTQQSIVSFAVASTGIWKVSLAMHPAGLVVEQVSKADKAWLPLPSPACCLIVCYPIYFPCSEVLKAT